MGGRVHARRDRLLVTGRADRLEHLLAGPLVEVELPDVTTQVAGKGIVGDASTRIGHDDRRRGKTVVLVVVGLDHLETAIGEIELQQCRLVVPAVRAVADQGYPLGLVAIVRHLPDGRPTEHLPDPLVVATFSGRVFPENRVGSLSRVGEDARIGHVDRVNRPGRASARGAHQNRFPRITDKDVLGRHLAVVVVLMRNRLLAADLVVNPVLRIRVARERGITAGGQQAARQEGEGLLAGRLLEGVQHAVVGRDVDHRLAVLVGRDEVRVLVQPVEVLGDEIERRGLRLRRAQRHRRGGDDVAKDRGPLAQRGVQRRGLRILVGTVAAQIGHDIVAGYGEGGVDVVAQRRPGCTAQLAGLELDHRTGVPCPDIAVGRCRHLRGGTPLLGVELAGAAGIAERLEASGPFPGDVFADETQRSVLDHLVRLRGERDAVASAGGVVDGGERLAQPARELAWIGRRVEATMAIHRGVREIGDGFLLVASRLGPRKQAWVEARWLRARLCPLEYFGQGGVARIDAHWTYPQTNGERGHVLPERRITPGRRHIVLVFIVAGPQIALPVFHRDIGQGV